MGQLLEQQLLIAVYRLPIKENQTSVFRFCFPLVPFFINIFGIFVSHIYILRRQCGGPAISLHSHHVSMIQWITCLLPVTRDPGSNPQGGTYVEPGFSCLRCLATLVTPTWWIIMASSEAGFVPKTITRPSCRQCDNPTWSHTAFLSLFHARCRSPFRLHNRQSRLLGGNPVESLQSHFILTMSRWSSELPVCLPSQGTQVQILRGVLMWNPDSPVSDVSLQQLIYFLYFIHEKHK
jgi:hypothetical protein